MSCYNDKRIHYDFMSDDGKLRRNYYIFPSDDSRDVYNWALKLGKGNKTEGNDKYTDAMTKWFGTSNETHIKRAIKGQKVLPHVEVEGNHIRYAYVPPYKRMHLISGNKKGKYNMSAGSDCEKHCGSGQLFRGLVIREKDRNRSDPEGHPRPLCIEFQNWKNRCKGYGLSSYPYSSYEIWSGTAGNGYDWLDDSRIYAPFATCKVVRNKTTEVQFDEIVADMADGTLPDAFPIDTLKYDYCSHNPTTRMTKQPCYDLGNRVYLNSQDYPSEYKALFVDSNTNREIWSKQYCTVQPNRMFGGMRNPENKVCRELCTEANELVCYDLRKDICETKYSEVKDDPKALADWLNDSNNECGCYLPDVVYENYTNDLKSKMGLTNSPSDLILSQTIDTYKEAIFPACARSQYKQGIETADNIVLCHQGVEVGATGGSEINVGGDVNVENVQDCIVTINQESATCSDKYDNWSDWGILMDGQWTPGTCYVDPTDGIYKRFRVRNLKPEYQDTHGDKCLITLEEEKLTQAEIDACKAKEAEDDDDILPPPTDDEDPPTDDEDPPTDDEDPPTDDEDPPTDDEDPPTDEEDPPTDDEDPPTDDEDPPTDDEDPPTDEEIPKKKSTGLSVGAIIGIVVGVIVLILILILIYTFSRKKTATAAQPLLQRV